MDRRTIDDLLRHQSGVVSRRQVLAAGGSDVQIERALRRRVWARVHPGVYVDHTGPLSWEQRAWSGVLHHWPSALAGGSALRAHGAGRDDDRDPIELVVSRSRRVDDPRGLRTGQLADFEAVALLHLGPPRVRIEHAALTVAARASTEDGAVAVLGDACQQRRSTPHRLAAALDTRPRLRHRRLLHVVLADLEQGANSALERRYLRDVERAHGLPRATRQERVVRGAVTAYRDASYRTERLVVELDGSLGHDATADRWDDLDRDLESVVAGEVTVRVGWRQVLAPCRLAERLGRLLQARGWAGRAHGCGSGCSTGEDPRQQVPRILA